MPRQGSVSSSIDSWNAPRVLEQRGDVVEQDAGLGKVRDLADLGAQRLDGHAVGLLGGTRHGSARRFPPSAMIRSCKGDEAEPRNARRQPARGRQSAPTVPCGAECQCSSSAAQSLRPRFPHSVRPARPRAWYRRQGSRSDGLLRPPSVQGVPVARANRREARSLRASCAERPCIVPVKCRHPRSSRTRPRRPWHLAVRRMAPDQVSARSCGTLPHGHAGAAVPIGDHLGHDRKGGLRAPATVQADRPANAIPSCLSDTPHRTEAGAAVDCVVRLPMAPAREAAAAVSAATMAGLVELHVVAEDRDRVVRAEADLVGDLVRPADDSKAVHVREPFGLRLITGTCPSDNDSSTENP